MPRPYILLCSPNADPEMNELVAPDTKWLRIWPLSILQLKTFLELNGVDVELFDQLCEPSDYGPVLAELIAKRRPVLIGLSVMTMQLSSALEISSTLRSLAPDIPLVWGGIHPTIEPEQTLADPLCDYVVFGEGEYTLLDLTMRLHSGQPPALPLPGLGFKSGAELLLGPKRPLAKLDDLPPMSYDNKYYKHYIVNINEPAMRALSPTLPPEDRWLIFPTARGCPSRCSFCYNAIQDQSPRYRFMSPGKTLDALERIIEENQINLFSWGDEHFFSNIARAQAILEECIRRGIRTRWYTTIRCDVFNKPEFRSRILPLLGPSGCSRLHLGVESGSQRVLDILNKRITPQDIESGVEMFKDSDIIFGMAFMSAVPGERPLDILDTVGLWDRLFSVKMNMFIMGPFLYRPYPGTPLFKTATDLGFPRPESMREWARTAYDARGGFKDRTLYPWVDDEHWTAIDYLMTVRSLYFSRSHDAVLSPGHVSGLEAVRERVRSGVMDGLVDELAMHKKLAS